MTDPAALPVVELPPWARQFEKPARFKGAYGGRGSGKSWAVARMLLLRAVSSRVRILCCRELQGSIRDSVHRLLADQIDLLGLGAFFDVGETFIRAKSGSEFVFRGLRHNAAEIKSTEGIGLCWIEEAQSVSAASWELLTPTIRAPGSELWATFNPSEPTDPTYRRFVTDRAPDTISVRVNWSDNPWFPPELDAERRWMARTDPDAYAHVWLGECRTITEAQVLRGKVSIEAFDAPGADRPDGPYLGVDWGFSTDPTTLVRCWITPGVLWIEHETYGIGVELDHLAELFDKVPESRRHRIRADSARPETISYMARQGFDIVAAEKGKGSVEHGVMFLRSFERIVIHPRCVHAIEEARLWSYKVDRLSGDVLPDLVDAHNHIWDAVRYALEPVSRGTNRVNFDAIESTGPSNLIHATYLDDARRPAAVDVDDFRPGQSALPGDPASAPSIGGGIDLSGY